MAQTANNPTIDRIEIVDQPEENIPEQRSSKRLLSLALLVGLLAVFLLLRRNAHKEKH
jgi:hypothetical protein